MLAAAPAEETRVLALFQLALRLIRQGQGGVPPELERYFNSVLAQARSLSNDPRAVQGQLLPEAIQLALDIRDLDGLKDEIEGAHDASTVSPALADRILMRLERRVAP
ncbi:hypothetical protein [Methylobacterium sp. Leaf361]|uniref:hypothetical protein n=1 Tax=Methylobacterium sp. Leaf361 TaxID=1736352 RepID=UPI0012FEA15A|nr:hypothetical protein [Methylobacterium sp. Leaf361]